MITATFPIPGKLVANVALAAGLQIATQPCTLLNAVFLNSHASAAQFIQIHDSATVPADTAIPKVVMKLAAGTFGQYIAATKFANGCYICNSSTAATKTAGAADCWFSGNVLHANY